MSEHTVVERVSSHCQPYGIPAQVVDGNDVFEVMRGVEDAVSRARSGGGPTMVECLTYRLRGHYVGDPANYRDASEVAEWVAKDPLRRLSRTLLESGALSDDSIQDIVTEAGDRLDESVRYALASPYLSSSDMTERVFS